MRKLFISIFLVALVTGCSSQATKQSSDTQASAPAMHGNPHAVPRPANLPVDPLQDPNSPLAKRSVYFDFDSSSISDADRDVLKAHAAYLGEHTATKITVEGNTDERGSNEYNIGLGERRAVAVKKFLVELGVSDSNVQVISFGKEKPVASCHDESCWKQNRHADIKY